MAEFSRQVQHFVHLLPGLLGRPQNPQGPGRKDETSNLRVEPPVEGCQSMVLRLVERHALLYRRSGTDKLPAGKEGAPSGVVRFKEQPGLVRLLCDLQTLLRQRLRCL